jgi:hypothetical protein
MCLVGMNENLARLDIEEEQKIGQALIEERPAQTYINLVLLDNSPDLLLPEDKLVASEIIS